MNAQEEALQLFAFPPRLGARGETKERNADLSENGVLQRVTLGLPRALLMR